MASISMDGGGYVINNEYVIKGDFEDGYVVYAYDDEEEEEALYSSISLDNCLCWCLNS